MNKILEFLKKSDFINKSYAENFYQIEEINRYKTFKNKINSNILILIALFSIVFNAVAINYSGVSTQNNSPLSILFYGIFIYIMFLAIKKIYFYLNKKTKKELKNEKEVINKLIYFDFLSDIDSIFGFHPSKEVLLTINLIAKEPFLTNNEKIDKIKDILNLDKKRKELYLIDDDLEKKQDKKEETIKTPVKAAVKKTPVKAAVKKTPVKAAVKKEETVKAAVKKEETVKAAVKKIPVKTAVKKTPVKTAVKKTPVKTAVKKTPVKTAVKKTPVKTAVKKTPVKTTVKKTPVKTEGEK